MNQTTQRDEQALDRLRQEFTGHRIWRAIRWDGREGDWIATLRDQADGVDLTVMRSDADALRRALLDERERAVARDAAR